MRILIAPDKFKGTLSAAQAARAIARGWRRRRPQDRLELLPMSDGGDGFGEILGALGRGRRVRLPTTDAAGRPRIAHAWWVARDRRLILEAAQSNGLALLPRGQFHPFDLDTTGVAALIKFAYRRGARECLIGVGGSATNDGGFGLARGLGWKFLDRQGREILRWTGLVDLHALRPPPSPPSARCRFIVATDVDNPLLGRRGATRVYGPQKGLRVDDLAVAEACLHRLAQVTRRQLGFDSRLPGCGAAGGLGFGLQAFLGATRQLGFDWFAREAHLNRRFARLDLLITGEGAFDRQSLMGKGVGQLVRRAGHHRCRTLVLAGKVEQREGPQWQARALTDITTLEEALASPGKCLARLAAAAASHWR